MADHEEDTNPGKRAISHLYDKVIDIEQQVMELEHRFVKHKTYLEDQIKELKASLDGLVKP